MKRILLFSTLLALGTIAEGRCPCAVGKKRAQIRRAKVAQPAPRPQKKPRPLAQPTPAPQPAQKPAQMPQLMPVKMKPAPTPKPQPAARPAPKAPAPMVKGDNRIVLQSSAEFESIINKHPVVVAIFSTTWCGPCKKLKPNVEQVTREMKNVVFLHVDGDKFGGLVSKHVPMGFPTIKVFKNGREVADAVGAQSVDQLKGLIRPHV